MNGDGGSERESKRFRSAPSSSIQGSDSDYGILDERILVLIFETMKWDLEMLCNTASVNRKLRAISERVLWRKLCLNRAPRMSASLSTTNGRVGGGWQAVAKLMFFCCGCEPSRNFRMAKPVKGHFINQTRFSKTSGQSFLSNKCGGDVLYVSDPCEHSKSDQELDDFLGIYRGVFKGFMISKTRAFLIREQVRLEERLRCPYCGARVWSMTSARLVPKSASRRLGTHNGGLEYFVCVNGHLYGSCWLLPLSSDEDEQAPQTTNTSTADEIVAVSAAAAAH